MAQRRKYGLFGVAASVFTLAAPFLGTAFDKSAVLGAFLSLMLFFTAIYVDRTASLPLSLPSFFVFAVTAYAFLNIIWASDKGRAFMLATVFALAFLMMTEVRSVKRRGERKAFESAAKAVLCRGAVIYAVFSVMYQFFISDKIFSYTMDFGTGAPFAAAMLMSVGVLCEMSLFKDKKKTPGFFAVMILLLYVLLLTRSLTGYFAALLTFGAYFVRRGKKYRVQAALFFLLAGIFFVISVICAIATLPGARPFIKAALYGTANIFGVGCGGYNARFSIVGDGYTGAPPLWALLAESYGIFGLAASLFAFVYGARRYIKKRRISDLLALLTILGVLLTPSTTILFTIPLIASCYASESTGVSIKVPRASSILCAAAGLFRLFLTFARLPLALCAWYADVGEYEKASMFAEAGAKMELFMADGWEKAYEAAYAACENGARNEKDCEYYLEMAMARDKKDLSYPSKLSELYSNEKRHDDALSVWRGIMDQCDDERLYPVYAEKISGSMSVSSASIEKERALYEELTLIAGKCEDAEIKKTVNDTLSKAQRYFVVSIEGEDPQGDMFESSTEIPSEEASEE